MSIIAVFGLPGWFWHPLNGLGYQFWSGIGSDIGELELLAGLITVLLLAYHWLRHHNCSVHGCLRVSLRKPTAAGDLVCRQHAPEEHHGKSHAQILADHHAAKETTCP